MRDIKEIMTMWKNSRIMNRMGMEYPSKSAGIIDAMDTINNRKYLTEDEAVFLLRTVDVDQHTVLVLNYLIYRLTYDYNH